MKNREIEVKFLEIDKETLIKKLKELEAKDLGEDLIREIIFYDRDLKWQKSKDTMVRLRQSKQGTFLTYKHGEEATATGMKEIEFTISNIDKAKSFLEELGLTAYRHQEKKRHKFLLGEVIIDIDTWPSVPTYVEIEGPSEEKIRETAKRLGFDWSKGVFGISGKVIEQYYKIPVASLRFFTFDRIE